MFNQLHQVHPEIVDQPSAPSALIQTCPNLLVMRNFLKSLEKPKQNKIKQKHLPFLPVSTKVDEMTLNNWKTKNTKPLYYSKGKNDFQNFSLYEGSVSESLLGASRHSAG